MAGSAYRPNRGAKTWRMLLVYCRRAFCQLNLSVIDDIIVSSSIAEPGGNAIDGRRDGTVHCGFIVAVGGALAA